MHYRRFSIALVALLLWGCESQVLFSDLSENEANEIVAALYSSDLTVEKVGDPKKNSYQIYTDKASFSRAVAVLQQQGLPRERFESVGEVFQKDGFVSSPLEERARLNYAISQELSRTISNIDGVIMSRVHLAVPKKAHLADNVEPSSASVFIKHRPDVDLSGSIGKIKSLIVTGMENLPYDNVTVALFPADPPTLPAGPESPSIQKASMGHISPSAVVAAMVMLLLSISGFWMVSLLKSRMQKRGETVDDRY
ncbi:MAG: type III secretion inner membrane ring lipoprotein SctJ [Pseudomonadota bacterium]